MTTLTDDLLSPAPPPEEPLDPDTPRVLSTTHDTADEVFRTSAFAIGVSVLVVTGLIGVFLGLTAIPTLRQYGASFFTHSSFLPQESSIGIASSLVGTFVVAAIALAFAFPLAFATALYISEYAPARIKGFLISLIDLMAAVPSIIFGAWGLKAFMPHALYIDRWIAQWFGWIPIFRVTDASPRDAPLAGTHFEASPFIAGMVVSLMVIPLACAIMRNVFSQAPIGEREAALALGSTRWGMIRAVVIPFARGGIIGGTMLGLGRALGETIAILLILGTNFDLRVRVLQDGAITISSLIANNFGDARGVQLDALLTAGFVLFCFTLVFNSLASVVIHRSRSGAGLEG
jgi:phosphate transport system permease protein